MAQPPKLPTLKERAAFAGYAVTPHRLGWVVTFPGQAPVPTHSEEEAWRIVAIAMEAKQ